MILCFKWLLINQPQSPSGDKKSPTEAIKINTKKTKEDYKILARYYFPLKALSLVKKLWKRGRHDSTKLKHFSELNRRDLKITEKGLQVTPAFFSNIFIVVKHIEHKIYHINHI